MLDALERWAADARARDAAEGRIRERHLLQAAREGATFAGTLLDLAERSGTVVVSMVCGPSHAGQIVAVGADFLGIRTLGDRIILVAFTAVADVSPAPTVRIVATGDRSVTALDVTLYDMLASATGSRSRLTIRCGERQIAGELHSVSADVLTVQSPGPPSRPSYVMLTSVSEVSFLDSG